MSIEDLDIAGLAATITALPEEEREPLIRQAARRLARTNIKLRQEAVQTAKLLADGRMLAESLRDALAEANECSDNSYEGCKARDKELAGMKAEMERVRRQCDDLKRRNRALASDLELSEDLAQHRADVVHGLTCDLVKVQEDLAITRTRLHRLQDSVEMNATEDPPHTSLEAMQAEGNAIDYSDIPF
jgi:chromosome segregation ATPase